MLRIDDLAVEVGPKKRVTSTSRKDRWRRAVTIWLLLRILGIGDIEHFASTLEEVSRLLAAYCRYSDFLDSW